MKEVRNILICGGGMMGSAIAQVFAGLDDVTITVYDKFPVDIEAKIRNNMKKPVWNWEHLILFRSLLMSIF